MTKYVAPQLVIGNEMVIPSIFRYLLLMFLLLIKTTTKSTIQFQTNTNCSLVIVYVTY